MSGLDVILNRRSPSAWDRFLPAPTLYLAQLIYSHSQALASNSPIATSTPTHVRLICISDTHGTHASQPLLPEGDILIHAGDLTHSGTSTELNNALSWLDSQSHPVKILIAGNHDVGLADAQERGRLLGRYPGLTYLQDEEAIVEVRGRPLRIYGSPRTPKHGSWPFQYPRVPASASHSDVWASIPPLTDILITHGPPIAHLDCDSLGCAAFLDALWRVRPRVHVFGHVHAGRGVERVAWEGSQRAYERVCRGEGWVRLMKLGWFALIERICGIWWQAGKDGTVLVNAAAVGGSWDERRLGAVVIDI